MRKAIAILLLLFLTACAAKQEASSPIAEHNFFDLSARQLGAAEISFNQFRGQVVLATNIALKCGTTPQLGQLEELYQTYKDRGLVVLGFPSDDFTGNSEPKDAKVISETCKLKYGVSFPLFQPGHVKGKEQQQVFKFLTAAGDESTRGELWFNFEKFLITRNGRVFKRYGPFTSATSIEVRSDVEKMLGNEAR